MAEDFDITCWLEGLGLSEYAEAFRENQIDAATLPELTDADLKELGIAALGPRKRLLAEIRRMALAAEANTEGAPPVEHEEWTAAAAEAPDEPAPDEFAEESSEPPAPTPLPFIPLPTAILREMEEDLLAAQALAEAEQLLPALENVAPPRKTFWARILGSK